MVSATTGEEAASSA